MIKLILIIIGAILLIWFLLPFFTYRILNIGNLTGIGVSLVLLLYGIFFHPVNRFLALVWKSGAGKVVEIVIGACILAILVLAVMCMVCMGRGMASGSQQHPGERTADDLPRTVIVLGCKTIGDRPSLMLTERLQAAYEYLEANPEAVAVVSGGLGEDETTGEAEVMFNWLVENGISSDRILQEALSTDTHENLANSYAIIREAGAPWSTNVLLATNEFHEYRALKIARAADFTAEALPAKTAWWLFPTYYIREMYGILEDWFLKP